MSMSQRFCFAAQVAMCGFLCVMPPRLAASEPSPRVPAEQVPAPKAMAPHDGSAGKKDGPSAMDGRCDRCGSCICVRKVCVPRPKEREISKTCWSYKCEDFCVPGPSVFCGKKFGHDKCGCWSYDVWQPTCAEVRTKKVPVKTEVKRKVPGVEWKLEERCGACRHAAPEDLGCAGK